MKKVNLFKVVAVVALFFGAHYVYADKIAILDRQKILSESQYGKKIKERLDQKFANRQVKLDSLRKSVAEKQKSLERDKEIMAKDEITKKQREITRLQQDFQRKFEDFQQDVQIAQSEELQTLSIKISEVLPAVAKNNKYDLVLPKENAFYSADSTDCTAKIIKALNDKFATDKANS